MNERTAKNLEIAGSPESERGGRISQNVRELLELVRGGVWVLDLEMKVMHANSSAAQMVGYQPSDFIGQPMSSYVAFEYRHFFEDGVLGPEIGSQVPLDLLLHHKSGQDIWAIATSSSLKDESGRKIGNFIFLTDITIRRNIEFQIKEREVRLTGILEALQDVIWSFSIPQNKFLFINRAVETVLGLPPEEFYSNPMAYLNILHEEDRPLIASDQIRIQQKGQVEGIYRILSPKGELRYINSRIWLTRDQNGQPLTIEGVMRDITERRRMEQRLRESMDRFKEIAENIRDVYFMMNLDATKMYYVSPAAEKILGINHREFIRDPSLWRTAIHPEDRTRVNGAIFSLVSEGFDVQYRIIRPDGEIRWVWGRGFPVYNEKGVPYRYGGIITDITKQKETERIIAQQREKIIAASKMSALGEMAGGIAHEINNPLAIIQLRSDQLKELAENGKLDSEKIIEAAKKIEFTANRISKIVKSLRTFARDGEIDPFQVWPVKSIIEDTVELCRERFKNRCVSLTLAPFPDDLGVECRPVQISQILLNLLNNAFDAVSSCLTKNIKITVVENGDQVEIGVEDTGHGVSPEIQEKIFQPFFTTKEIGKGTGLGLSVSKGIAESHWGHLTLDTQSVATRFLLNLPKNQKKKSPF